MYPSPQVGLSTKPFYCLSYEIIILVNIYLGLGQSETFEIELLIILKVTQIKLPKKVIMSRYVFINCDQVTNNIYI